MTRHLHGTHVMLSFLLTIYIACTDTSQHLPEYSNMMIRIAEIEVDSAYLDTYIAILRKESEASVRSEPDVLCIYPMLEKEQPTQIRLLEIYANKDAYEMHLQSPHFQEYKASTLHMVKSLRLIDMEAIDTTMMPEIFKKIAATRD